MKKQLFLIVSLLGTANISAYRYTVQNRTNNTIRVQLTLSAPRRSCATREFSVDAGQTGTESSAICCINSALIEQKTNRVEYIPHFVRKCENYLLVVTQNEDNSLEVHRAMRK